MQGDRRSGRVVAGADRNSELPNVIARIQPPLNAFHLEARMDDSQLHIKLLTHGMLSLLSNWQVYMRYVITYSSYGQFTL